jgi:rubrerythrin
MSHAAIEEQSQDEVLENLMAAEREARELLERAAHAATDPEERALFERLARREEQTLAELQKEKERLEAEEFVQRALDC